MWKVKGPERKSSRMNRKRRKERKRRRRGEGC